MSLLDLFKNHLVSQEKSSKLTVKNYLSDVGHFVEWFEKKTNKSFDPKLINPDTITSYKIFASSVFSPSTLERHLSSLRKFFKFLFSSNLMYSNPFEQLAKNQKAETDVWRLNDFKNNLFTNRSSHLTIKNYIIDIRQFLVWAQNTKKPQDDTDLTAMINTSLIEGVKNFLLFRKSFFPCLNQQKTLFTSKICSMGTGTKYNW